MMEQLVSLIQLYLSPLNSDVNVNSYLILIEHHDKILMHQEMEVKIANMYLLDQKTMI
jgi:hypothetical protein